jgi:hypothetical protein
MSKQLASQQPNAVAAAEATLAELMERAHLLAQARTELEADRKATAYAAHAQHDAEANKRLGGIVDALVRHDADMAALADAIAEAESRVELAQRARTVAADQANARKVRAQLHRFVKAGREIDGAMAELVEASNAMRQALTQMHILGCKFPSHEQLSVLGDRALRTALMQTAWARYFEGVSPGERKTFTALVEAWATMVDNNIRPRLAAGTQEAA